MGIALAAALICLRTAPADTSSLQRPLAPAAISGLPFNSVLGVWRGLRTISLRVEPSGATERFVIATGLNACTLTPPAARYLLTSPVPGSVGVAALWYSQSAAQARMPLLRGSEMQIRDLTVAVLDVAALLSPASAPLDHPNGWLGSSFFMAVDLSLDFRDNQAVFALPSASPAARPAGVPVELDAGRPTIGVTVNGSKPFAAVVDTGSAGTLIPGAVADALKLKPERTVRIAGPDGPLDLQIATIRRLTAGGQTVQGMRVAFVKAGAKPEIRRTAILGLDFLQRFRMTLSLAQKRMLLVRPSAPKRPKGSGAANGDTPPDSDVRGK